MASIELSDAEALASRLLQELAARIEEEIGPLRARIDELLGTHKRRSRDFFAALEGARSRPIPRAARYEELNGRAILSWDEPESRALPGPSDDGEVVEEPS